MILAVDIGNSSLKCAVVDRNVVLGRESLLLDRCKDSVAVADVVRRVSSSVLSVERVVVSSVVPSLNDVVCRAIRDQLGEAAQIIDFTWQLPFTLDVPTPSQTGTDRICAAAGALGLKRKHGVIIDAGSAITVDIVDGGRFLGGIIIAGPSISLRALNQYASKLPALDFPGPGKPWSKSFNTTDLAMTLGAGLGAVGAIKESVRYLEAAAGRSPSKYFTGGCAETLSARFPRSWVFDPDLTLKGISVVAEGNPPESTG